MDARNPRTVISWMKNMLNRQRQTKEDSDAFFVIEELLAEEEDGYLPSVINIDDFLSPNNQSAKPTLLSWTKCILLGIFLGAATFLIYSLLLPVSSITQAAAESNPSYFHQPGQHPSLSTHATTQKQSLPRTQWNADNPPHSPCGNSSSAAHAAGCKFGALAYAWYPAACYDLHTETEFLAAQDWKWYSEPRVSYPIDYESRIREADGETEGQEALLSAEYQRAQRELPRQDILRGIHDRVYTDAAYWDEFCVFAERKLWRAVAGALGGDEEKILLDNYNVETGLRSECLAGRPEEPYMLVMKFLDCVQW